ncbi:MAG: hypothetical protein PVH19_11430 [Planctomycetia bacterium]|jgi:hypothetical protein
MERDYTNDAFLEIVVAHCEGTATEADRHALARMLRKDPKRRRQFVLHMQLHAAMKFGGPKFFEEDKPSSGVTNFGLPDPTFFEGMSEDTLLDFGDMSSLCSANETAGKDAAFRSPLFSLFTFFSKPVPLTVIMICVIVLPVVMLAWNFNAHQPDVAPTCVVPGQVVKTVACTWDEEQGIGLQAGDLLIGDREYHLKEGIVQLDFASGVQTIIQGPAIFRSKSSMLLEFTQGRLSAKVPPKGKNFTVVMAGLEVIDRGTEFAIDADGTTDVELHVFKGQIDVLAESWEQNGNNRSLELHAGEASLVDRSTGEVEMMVADPSKFVCEFTDDSGLSLILTNPGFEEPRVTRGTKSFDEIAGWQVMNAAGGSSVWLERNIPSNALDGTQMLAVKLTDQVNKVWVFQPIDTIKIGDIGRTLMVSADVIAKTLAGTGDQPYGDTATAVLAFTVDGDGEEPGEVIGFPGFVTGIKTDKQSQPLEAKMHIRPYMVGKKLSIQLLIRDTKVKADRQNEYFFDKVKLNASTATL